MKIKKTRLTEFLTAGVQKFVEDNGMPKNLSQDIEKSLTAFTRFLKTTKSGRSVRSELRKRLNNFTIKSADREAGTSYVDVAGVYLIGPAPSSQNLARADVRTRRMVGEEIIADVFWDTWDDILQESSFKYTEENNYESVEDLEMAVYLESGGSKGPYDGSGIETGIETICSVLDESSGDGSIPDEFMPAVECAMNRHYGEVMEKANPDMVFDPAKYTEYMFHKQLSNTLRGCGYLSAGDKVVTEWQHDWVVFILSFTTNFKNDGFKYSDLGKMWKKEHSDPSKEYKRFGFTDTRKFYTVDDHIQMVMCYLKEHNLKLSDWYHPIMNVIVPINRDQGAGWKLDFDFAKYKVKHKERSARKYRAVCPVGALPQAWLIMATIDLITITPTTARRVGLETPSVNAQRTIEKIRRSIDDNRIRIPSDFSSYDMTLLCALMILMGLAEAKCYNDEFVKDAIAMQGVVISQKLLLFPIKMRDREKEKIYAKHIHWDMRSVIKGDAKYNLQHTLAGLKNKEARKLAEVASEKKFDYSSAIFYIYLKYLISGVIVTNSNGSACSNAIASDLVPYYIMLHKEDILHGKYNNK